MRDAMVIVIAVSIAACARERAVKECIPGDESLANVICSSEGQWIYRQAGECLDLVETPVELAGTATHWQVNFKVTPSGEKEIDGDPILVSSGADVDPAAASSYRASQPAPQVPRCESVDSVDGPSRTLCPVLPPGTYVLRKSVASGGPDCLVLPDELIVVLSDGEVITQENALAAMSCTDSVTVDGCTTILQRSCELDGCSGELLFVLDGSTWTGVVSLAVACQGSASRACSYDAWLESR